MRSPISVPFHVVRAEMERVRPETRPPGIENAGPGGVPSQITYEVVEEICDRIAKGETYTSIAQDPHMPSVPVMYKWKRKFPWFEEMYRQARQDFVDTLVDQTMDIADDARNDFMERVNGKTGEVTLVPNDEHIRRSQIRIMARQWLAERMAPKKYGPKGEMALANPDGTNLAQAPTQIVLIAATAEDGKALHGEGLDPGDMVEVEIEGEDGNGSIP